MDCKELGSFCYFSLIELFDCCAVRSHSDWKSEQDLTERQVVVAITGKWVRFVIINIFIFKEPLPQPVP